MQQHLLFVKARHYNTNGGTQGRWHLVLKAFKKKPQVPETSVLPLKKCLAT
jgi:hypothetical protein